MEEMEEAMGAPKHLTNNIVKGKRTKRQRPQSPIPFSIPTPSISTEENEEDDDDQDIYNPSSSEFDEEEEEMANCLILLAQGHYPPKIEDHQRQYVSKRYTSKRFVESDGKEGVYVYQCKTCDRSFPSFQALGGHRASHKKPKGGLVVEEKKIQRQLSFLSSDCEEDESVGGVEKKPKVRTASTNSLVQLQLLSGSYTKSSPKVHECGICGAEFGSGQALGGHMRRHRVAVGTNVNTNSSANASHGHVPTSTSLTLVSGFDLEMDKELTKMKKSKNLLSLDLDLNLPAPADEEKQQQKHKQQQQQQQQQSQNQSGLVLSTATLVDCHY